ncbi:MAG: phytanoyl-CoA dioxygenase family protein [Planctomycetes bacterium]|nr:phytanoyl-CoA dioxygenase family protein [Planctomycetota bacterium]
MTEPQAIDDLWQRDGCIVVPAIFAADRIARLRGICDAVRTRWLERDPQTGLPGGDPASITAMRHLNHPDYHRDRPEALVDLLEACADEAVLSVLRVVWREEPLFRCTSLFFNPTVQSTEGNWHRDCQFGRPEAEDERAHILAQRARAAGGVQIQIALVANDDLEFVPGSQSRWDDDEELRVRRSDAFAHATEPLPGALRLALQPGDAAFFDPMGLHRGRYHADRPRRSLMLTYTPTSMPASDWFSAQPWCLEPGYLDDVSPATHAFFTRFIAAYRDGWTAAESASAAS